MSSATVTTLGFVLMLMGTGVLELLAHQGRVRVLPVEVVLNGLARNAGARILGFVVWFWLGWHFLAR